MDHIERLCNILSESKVVWYLLRNMENIASSVSNTAQSRFSLSRKVVQWISSRVNNYGYESNRRREKIYFSVSKYIILYRLCGMSRARITAKEWKKKNEQYDHLLRKCRERFADAENHLIKKFNSLPTNFRRELKRIKDSEKSGFSHSFIHLRFFFSFFFKHTASAVPKQLASVSLNMLATEGSDFN